MQNNHSEHTMQSNNKIKVHQSNVPRFIPMPPRHSTQYIPVQSSQPGNMYLYPGHAYSQNITQAVVPAYSPPCPGYLPGPMQMMPGRGKMLPFYSQHKHQNLSSQIVNQGFVWKGKGMGMRIPPGKGRGMNYY